MSSTLYSDLSHNFGLLLNNEIKYNVVIQVGVDAGYKEFRAHSIILRSRSPYFQKSFSSNEIKDENNIYTFKFPNINQTVFQTILTYIYTGSVDLNFKQEDEIFYILHASDKFSLDTLTKFTEKYLIENHSEYIRKYSVKILRSILNTNYTFDELQELCLDTICYEPKLLFHANNFTRLPAPLLEIVLKRDDLNLVEIEIWESLIKWGVAQVSRQLSNSNPNIWTNSRQLSNNPNEWTKENFTELERNIHNLIPLIRFYEISSKDHFKKIGPYEEILPKELKQDIFQFHMVREHTPMFKSSPRILKNIMNFDSIILNRKQFINLANLMDDKDNESAYINNISYNFKLEYRLIKCYSSTCILFLNYKFRFNKNSSFVIVFSFRNSNSSRYDSINKGSHYKAGGYLYSSKYCRGGYFYCNHKNEEGKVFAITDWENIVTENISFNFDFLHSCQGKVSFEIFRVENAITNTLKTKGKKMDKVVDKIDRNVNCKNKVSLIRRVTFKIFDEKRITKKTPKSTYDD
ncbi:BTB/POZ domain-containing protein [Rhizophagus irregularis DAOM 181602=DAOM 197198]|uniref:BTB domain-containing protein n=4 Tax=Rhizophagus irregularis TaxID=588596 RepID=U9TRS5_RHIID|nr:hypothetical protein GLOIN_2v1817158 [Rhizophagus irregularis DAOM 181602=DAOM 197198]EXX64996.1 hypothetical protein RirG_137540 [Rhizophagus irregularis DAOM 197198w]POG60106.1 hypothetical protein GLOIN_2v1817158 [Rhizophagus irregularis DAOM 181602=DAOM 197198]GBC27658.1 BTB/POZ domain-containing protein [Rhizophagus irregularis DAOM 181602=DAOM 197198]|eukprot:XP_025166972.1 hypothetical protein GLOIN_2v1817158 [Rhizophagus irregularis DAOM 181602=DAOM 197198]